MFSRNFLFIYFFKLFCLQLVIHQKFHIPTLYIGWVPIYLHFYNYILSFFPKMVIIKSLKQNIVAAWHNAHPELILCILHTKKKKKKEQHRAKNKKNPHQNENKLKVSVH